MSEINIYDIKFKDLSLSELEYLGRSSNAQIHKISESEKVKAWKVVGHTGSASLDFYFYENEFEKAKSLLVNHLETIGEEVVKISISTVHISIDALKDLIKEQEQEEYEDWLNGKF